MHRLYGWRYNPLYQSGTIVVVAFVAMFVTGLYLLLFYRVGGPYESMLRIEGQVFAGRWIRALHRYAADLTIVAGALHAFRMLVQGRTWGARSLAWVSGILLMILMFVCGWTGYVMLWDAHAQMLAVEGARLLDALPIFSEPISRVFVGEYPIPGAFFFLNLFLHVALPIGVALLLWVHVSRISRPVLLPPRPVLWTTVGLLFAASVIVPAPLGPEAGLHLLAREIRIDWFYSFWVPWTRAMTPGEVWIAILAVVALAVSVPLWTRPRGASMGAPSRTDEDHCTGCFQCSYDCPYDAIAMVEHQQLTSRMVSHVDESLCVSCGICAASCAPMVIGPPERSGREELRETRAFLERHKLGADDVVLIACERGAGRLARAPGVEGAILFPTQCVGNVHTSVVEFLLRSGAGGVLVASCPPRDCWNREGPKWLEERLFHGREAELRESVDRRRIGVVYAAEGEKRPVLRALTELRAEIARIGSVQAEPDVEIETMSPRRRTTRCCVFPGAQWVSAPRSAASRPPPSSKRCHSTCVGRRSAKDGSRPSASWSRWMVRS
jgi:cytochrome b6